MSLLSKAKQSVIWNTGFNLFRDILQFCVMLALVRLLEPDDYGKFTLATNVIGLISAFAFQNFIAHTIQVRKEEEVNYQLHFTVGGVIQFSLFIITNIVAMALRYWESYSDIAPLVHVLSITFLLEWPCELRRKILERKLDWRRLRVLHGIGLIASSILAVTMGFLGFGVYALVIPGLLVTIPFIYELFFIMGWRPTWEWNLEKFQSAYKFGVVRIGSSLTNKIRPLIESAVIVQSLGYASVGILGRAVGLAMMLCQKFTAQLMYAIYPVLTKVDPGTEKYRLMSALVLRFIAWFSIPIAVIFSIISEAVVIIIYGEKWTEIIPLLPWAMSAAAIGSLVHVIYNLLLAHEEHKKCMWMDLLFLIGNLGALIWMLPYGLDLYIIGLFILQIILFGIVCFWLIKAGGISMDGVIKALAPAMAGVIGAYFICNILNQLMELNISLLYPALIYAGIFFILYVCIIRLLFKATIVELVSFLPAKNQLLRLLLIPVVE